MNLTFVDGILVGVTIVACCVGVYVIISNYKR